MCFGVFHSACGVSKPSRVLHIQWGPSFHHIHSAHWMMHAGVSAGVRERAHTHWKTNILLYLFAYKKIEYI